MMDIQNHPCVGHLPFLTPTAAVEVVRRTQEVKAGVSHSGWRGTDTHSLAIHRSARLPAVWVVTQI